MESFDDVVPKQQEEKTKEPVKKEYTLEDLKLEQEWDSGFGPNNPGAELRKIKNHNRRLREIESDLKSRGLLEYTEKEKITSELDKLFPNSKSKRIVEHDGKRYQMRYYPLDRSKTGKTVFEWGHKWELLDK